jgi:hypothetical protein
MIVEPVPTVGRSRRRRALARLALIAPPVLLAAVVAAGVLGGNGPGARPSAVALTRTPAPSPPTRPVDPAPAPTSASPPATIDGLRVRLVTDVVAERASGRLPPADELVAVAGYLSLPGLAGMCLDTGDGERDVLDPLCERAALLTWTTWSLDGGDFSGIGPHVHLRVPIGVRLPDAIGRTTGAASDRQVEVVVIGRVDPAPGGPCSAGSVCETSLRLDDVAWQLDGTSASGPVLGPGISSPPIESIRSSEADAERAALGAAGEPFVSALLRPGAVARLEPDAAAAIRRASPAGDVWYVRGIPATAIRSGAPGLAWAVVDDVNLDVVASGRIGSQPARSPRP